MSPDTREAPPIQVIREHPPLLAELVRQAGVALPEQVEVDLDGEDGAVLRGDADTLPLTVKLRERAGTWSALVTRDAEVLATKQLSDHGLDLGGSSPWLVIFAATLGSLNMKMEDNRDRVLHAIDEVAADVHATQRLVTSVMLATPERVRIRLESSMGTMWPPVDDLREDAEEAGVGIGAEDSRVLETLNLFGSLLTGTSRQKMYALAGLDEVQRRVEQAQAESEADQRV